MSLVDKPLAMEPGTSEAGRNSRYLTMFQTMHRENAIVEQRAETMALTQTSQSGLTGDDFLASRRQMAKSRTVLDSPKELTAKSESHTGLHDYREEAADIADTPEEQLREAFAAMDVDGSGYLDKKEFRRFLRYMLGKDPTGHQVVAFRVFFDENRDGRVTLDELLRRMPQIQDYFAEHREPHFSHQRKPVYDVRESAPEVTRGQPVRSTAQLDVGLYGSAPKQRPLLDRETGGLLATTKDLFTGTSKATRHVPGYAGFLAQPEVPNLASQQSFGGQERSTFDSKTLLTHTHNTQMPGYGGHVPHDGQHAEGGRFPRGLHAATTKEAADGLVTEYWAARGRGAAAGGGGAGRR